MPQETEKAFSSFSKRADEMIYILIPAHNNKYEVLEILACLSKQSYKDARIVLVDDGSTDNTEDEVKKLFHSTTILKGNGNLWWTGANVVGVNHILEEAKQDDFILLLNNDLVVGPDYVDAIVKASLSHERAIVGSTLVDYDNPDSIESGVQFDHHLNLIVNRDRTNIATTEYDLNVNTLPGRGTLVPIEVFERIGNFNINKLPHYGADYEFTVRAKRAGFKLMVSHRAKVFAKLGITGLDLPQGTTRISLRYCWNLLFSKKSRMNLLYSLNYVWLCSEKDFRVRNTARGAINILIATVGKTSLSFFLYLILSPRYIFKFLFKEYPLRLSDIQVCGLNPKDLIAADVLIKGQFMGKAFYYFNPGNTIKSGIAVSENNIALLRKLSKKYRHKFSILLEAAKLLVRRKGLNEI